MELAKEAVAGGVWFRQLRPGKQIALQPKDEPQKLLFGAAKQMQNYIYLVGCSATRECYAIDASWDVDGIAAYAKRHRMRLVGALGTHFHFDHIGGEVPEYMRAMVYGPFGAPKGEVPRTCGLKEMGTDHGCKVRLCR